MKEKTDNELNQSSEVEANSNTENPACDDVKKISFPDLDDAGIIGGNNPLSILNDVPLKIVVELGRTVLRVEDILELGIGSIIELDKVSGEPVDILVNGMKIAKGEVVVIDEDFGVRITDLSLNNCRENNEKAAK